MYTAFVNIRSFLIQAYYTPFFIKIQAFCKKADRFVDYDKIYVNIVMLTFAFYERSFLPFSRIMTISSVFKVLISLNIDFATSLSFSLSQVSDAYLAEFFVHIYNRRFFRRLPLSLFSAQ